MITKNNRKGNSTMHTIDDSGLWTRMSVALTCLVLLFGIVGTVVYGRSKTDDNAIKEGYEHSIDFSKYTRDEFLSEILIRERLTHYYKNHDYTVHFLSKNGRMYYSHHNKFAWCKLCDKEKGIIKNEL